MPTRERYQSDPERYRRESREYAKTAKRKKWLKSYLKRTRKKRNEQARKRNNAYYACHKDEISERRRARYEAQKLERKKQKRHEYYIRTRDRFKDAYYAMYRTYYAKSKDKVKDRRYQRLYGITLIEARRRLKEQAFLYLKNWGKKMPVRRVVSRGKPAYQWGMTGTKYAYTPGNKKSRKRAKQRAIDQGIAAAWRTGKEPHP